MKFNIVYSDKAVKQLKKIAKIDKSTASLILNTIEKFALNPDGKHDIKFLKGKFGQLKRLRKGDYRIVFDNDSATMYVYYIKHRKDVYND